MKDGERNVIIPIAGLQSDESDFLKRSVELFVQKRIHLGCHL